MFLKAMKAVFLTIKFSLNLFTNFSDNFAFTSKNLIDISFRQTTNRSAPFKHKIYSKNANFS